MTRAWISAAIIACALEVELDARAQDAQGYAELRSAFFPGVSGDAWQLVEHVRPTLTASFGERVKLVATIEAGFAEGRDPTKEVERTLRASDFEPLLEANMCTWPPRENTVLNIDRASDYLDVDRLHLDLYAGAVDLRLGRQAINWGSALFFNPTDPFPEVLLAEPWRPRRGVNAVRANVPLSEAIDATAVFAMNDALDTVRAAGRVRLNALATDFALVGVYRGDDDNGLVGLDLRGTLGVGWWIESAYFVGHNAHEELAVGIDYSFPIFERATAFLEYYRNGAGSTNVSTAQQLSTGGAVRPPECKSGAFPLGAGSGSTGKPDPFAPFVHGKNYLLLGGSLAFEPELMLSVSALQNLDDGSGVFFPTITYDALDWLDVAFSANVPYALWGEGGELKPAPEDLRVTIGGLSADFSGFIPAATLTLWTRASF